MADRAFPVPCPLPDCKQPISAAECGLVLTAEEMAALGQVGWAGPWGAWPQSRRVLRCHCACVCGPARGITVSALADWGAGRGGEACAEVEPSGGQLPKHAGQPSMAGRPSCCLSAADGLSAAPASLDTPSLPPLQMEAEAAVGEGARLYCPNPKCSQLLVADEKHAGGCCSPAASLCSRAAAL